MSDPDGISISERDRLKDTREEEEDAEDATSADRGIKGEDSRLRIVRGNGEVFVEVRELEVIAASLSNTIRFRSAKLLARSMTAPPEALELVFDTTLPEEAVPLERRSSERRAVCSSSLSSFKSWIISSSSRSYVNSRRFPLVSRDMSIFGAIPERPTVPLSPVLPPPLPVECV